MIRFVLVDVQDLVRAGQRVLAEHDDNFEVVAEADSDKAGIPAARWNKSEVVLVDNRMPQLVRISASQEIVADRPQLVILRYKSGLFAPVPMGVPGMRDAPIARRSSPTPSLMNRSPSIPGPPGRSGR